MNPTEDPPPIARRDDTPTIIAISLLGYILQNVVHEGIGHGVTAWLSGARVMTMSTLALQSDASSRLISAGGTLVNLFVAAILWIVLKRGRYNPATRYFLVIAVAGNLFSGTGYFLFSGVLNFGDWAAVISGLHPHWLWRVGLIVLGAASYYASMLLIGAELRPFRRSHEGSGRVRRLCWTPYVTQGVLAGVAGLLNPLGMFYVVASGLASTLGANAGLISLPWMINRPTLNADPPVDPIVRSRAFIVAAAIATLLFVFVLGRGVTFSR